jgi:outer membrane protein insertion porin family
MNVPDGIGSASRRGSRAAAFAAALAVVWGVFFTTPPVSAQQQDALQGRVVVGSVQVEGAQRVALSTVMSTVDIAAGDTISILEINQALGRLWATSQFRDVQIITLADSLDASRPVTLRVVVEEQPLVTSVEFRGLENIRPSAIRDTVGLRAGGPLRPGQVEQAKVMVRSLLAKKGFQVRSVVDSLIPVEGADNEVRLVFDVSEGQRVAVAEVVFEGNEAFSDEQLGKVMSTKPEGFFWFRGGTYDEDRLRADLRERLPQFYSESGYIDFAVVRDSLYVDQTTGKGRLIVELDEGAQYVLDELDIRGNRRYASEDLRRYFEQRRGGGLLSSLGLSFGSAPRPESGEAFDAVAFQAAAQQVRQLYSNTGYIYASADPVVERLPPAEEGGNPRVRATLLIEEGQPAFINEVRIVGNTFTHEDVIRGQLMTLPGDLYSEELLIQSYRRISALGFFETPMPSPDIQPTESGDVDIVFEVREKQTGSINFGTSLGGITGVAGFLGYDQPNLFGQAKSGHLRWEFGRYSNNFEASYTDPAIMRTRYSGSVSLFSSRDRFFTFQEGRRRRTGSALRFGVPFWLDPFNTRIQAGYSLSRTTYEEFDEEEQSSLFSLPPGIQSTLTLGLSRSTIDHPIFPTQGSRQDLTADMSGGFLGGDGTFQKYQASGSWYVPVGSLGGSQPGSRPIRMTLGLNVETGAIFGDASRFPFERFWMGGVQFGRPLRGYDETTITPIGYVSRGNNDVALENRFGDAYLLLSAEYAVRMADNISIGAFYDAGGVWRSPGEINPTRLLRGAGLSLTLVTPFGPLGLDYAYGFDKQPPGWQLHFKFGQGF